MKIVVNHSRGWNRAVVDLPAAPGQDLDRVVRVTEAVIQELNEDPMWQNIIVEPFVVMGFERIATLAYDDPDLLVLHWRERFGRERDDVFEAAPGRRHRRASPSPSR